MRFRQWLKIDNGRGLQVSRRGSRPIRTAGSSLIVYMKNNLRVIKLSLWKYRLQYNWPATGARSGDILGLLSVFCSGTSGISSAADAVVAMETDWQPWAVCGLTAASVGGRGSVGWWAGALSGRRLTSMQAASRVGVACDDTVGRCFLVASGWHDFLLSRTVRAF